MTSGKDPMPNVSENLTELSHDAVGKLLSRRSGRGSLRKKQQNGSAYQNESHTVLEVELNKRRNLVDVSQKEAEAVTRSENAHGEKSFEQGPVLSMEDDEMDDFDWEDGSVLGFESEEKCSGNSITGLTVEFDITPQSSKRKSTRRASAEDKECADLVHKTHLLCLLARGRIVDKACDDPLIQASLLSLVPKHFLKLMEAEKLTTKSLSPLVSWFQGHFKVTKAISDEKPFPSALSYALQTQNGTSEENTIMQFELIFALLASDIGKISILTYVELGVQLSKYLLRNATPSPDQIIMFLIAALSVALFRALKFTARFVSILDVVSLKPELEKGESSSQGAQRPGKGIFKSPTVMVPKQSQTSDSPGGSSQLKKNEDNNHMLKSADCLADYDTPAASESGTSQSLKRKGDLEFEMQMQIALSATTFESRGNISGSGINCESSPTSKRLKTISERPPASPHFISTAVGAKKNGSPLYWAEVFCNGENLTGKWVHVDVINAIIDGELKVEAAAAACKTQLRYVVAFAGHGAKDVTRRYCTKWCKIVTKRVNSAWWDEVMAPLKELELRATDVGGSARTDPAARSSIEDLEMETRALTEPLPTNQQAYRNHPLYALERWLNKYQILHPKGPVLGVCSGHLVYPRSCVQTLKTKQRWLREALQVKVNELPVKVLKRSGKPSKGSVGEEEEEEDDYVEGTLELYGKWQLEPLCLPHAVDGVVPKDERGQVEVWSEKCLPHGTVHLRLPRIFGVAKTLGIDYAPAMVGFEFRNGRSVPTYDGIVVCSEFKDVLLEAYAEEKERKEAEERKRHEGEALSRWYQLLSSILTRQRLTNLYGDGSKLKQSDNKTEEESAVGITNNSRPECQMVKKKSVAYKFDSADGDGHEHVFLKENQSFDEKSLVITKRCECGFSIQVEEL